MAPTIVIFLKPFPITITKCQHKIKNNTFTEKVQQRIKTTEGKMILMLNKSLKCAKRHCFSFEHIMGKRGTNKTHSVQLELNGTLK